MIRERALMVGKPKGRTLCRTTVSESLYGIDGDNAPYDDSCT